MWILKGFFTVVPARAGVIPTASLRATAGTGCSRASGDDPKGVPAQADYQ